MGSRNRRLPSLSSWTYAALWAFVMASSTTVGLALGGWTAGDAKPLEALLIGGSIGLVVLPAARLMAPATLQGMRQHRLWREERRRQRSRQP